MTEWDARDYNRISTLQKVLAEEHLALIKLAGHERILDIGCGDGKVTAEIAARVSRGSVLGVDPSHQMIDFASGHFGAPNVANLHFEVGDARRLPYRNEFDLIVSFNALHWVREQEQVLASIKAALKPGGRAVLEFVPRDNDRHQSLEDTIEEVRQTPRWASHFEGFTQPFFHYRPEEYRKFATAAGLEVAHLDVEPGRWDFGSRQGFAGFCHGTFVEWIKRVPKDQHDAFITDVLDTYCQRAADAPAEANTFKFYQMVVDLRRP
ncbi:MAG: trans-aconitate 2-methyltransferase [Gemmataceae bacterium]